MLIVRSRNGVAVRLTEELWAHIVGGHPELEGQRDRVLETVAEPELMQEGDHGAVLGMRWIHHHGILYEQAL